MNAVRRGAGAGLAFCAALLAGVAQADDAAARRIIGFSPDGRYFAFEQYGTQDWSENESGYCEIAIIDAESDSFVGGKPIKVVDEKGGGAAAIGGSGCANPCQIYDRLL